MARVQALVAALVMTIISRHSVVEYFSSLQQQRQEESEDRCFPALFSFGSSVADTGTQPIAFPPQPTQRPPYGSTFFGGPANRYSDGRLIIDFWAEALKVPFLDPYLKSVGSNFRRGANFAASGSTACNSTTFSPFPLSMQLLHFRDFKRGVLALEKKGLITRNRDEGPKLPQEEYFGNALYVIAIGGNDILSWAVIEHRPFQEIELLLPQITEAILWSVEALYAEGARHILVEDVFPQGCTPYFIKNLASEYPGQLDDVGCLKPINRIVQLHNSLLRKGILDLGRRLSDASISFVNTYNIRYGIIINHNEYGFTEPIIQCCGSDGDPTSPFDFKCGGSTIENGTLITGGSCNNVSSHVIWDALHFTEAFNRVTMKGILSGNYFEPHFDLIRNGCVLAEI